ncbi:MAG: hypothetical protein H0X13_11660 [Ramlibacter sp.]|nr:hypothetical protein [Ramlibacter sp.]
MARLIASTSRAMKQGDEQFHLLVDAVKDYAMYLLDPSGVITPGIRVCSGSRGIPPAR